MIFTISCHSRKLIQSKIFVAMIINVFTDSKKFTDIFLLPDLTDKIGFQVFDVISSDNYKHGDQTGVDKSFRKTAGMKIFVLNFQKKPA